MSIFEVGRLCVKLAGRDAGRKCVVVETVAEGYVVVDGDVRRKKVNVKHLEPLETMLKLKAKASHAEVSKSFEGLGLAVWETKPKKAAARPMRQRLVKRKATAVEKKVKPKKAKKEATLEETPIEA